MSVNMNSISAMYLSNVLAYKVNAFSCLQLKPIYVWSFIGSALRATSWWV